MSNIWDEFVKSVNFLCPTEEELLKCRLVSERYSVTEINLSHTKESREAILLLAGQFSPLHPEDKKEQRYFYAVNWFNFSVANASLPEGGIERLIYEYPHYMSALFDELHEKYHGYRWE